MVRKLRLRRVIFIFMHHIFNTLAYTTLLARESGTTSTMELISRIYHQSAKYTYQYPFVEQHFPLYYISITCFTDGNTHLKGPPAHTKPPFLPHSPVREGILVVIHALEAPFWHPWAQKLTPVPQKPAEEQQSIAC
jgi:hypothetical protein